LENLNVSSADCAPDAWIYVKQRHGSHKHPGHRSRKRGGTSRSRHKRSFDFIANTILDIENSGYRNLR